MMQCDHPYIYPDGDCVACGALATSFPGKVEGYHKMVQRDSRIARDAEAGRHSNIPACCISAFLQGQRPHAPGIGYVMCQSCITAGVPPVTLHYCSLRCQDFLVRIGYSASDAFAICLFNDALSRTSEGVSL